MLIKEIKLKSYIEEELAIDLMNHYAKAGIIGTSLFGIQYLVYNVALIYHVWNKRQCKFLKLEYTAVYHILVSGVYTFRSGLCKKFSINNLSWISRSRTQ